MPRAVFKASSRDLILHYLAQVFSGETNIGLNLFHFRTSCKTLAPIQTNNQDLPNDMQQINPKSFHTPPILSDIYAIEKLGHWDTFKGGKFLCVWNNCRHYFYEDGTLFEHNLLCGTLPAF